MQIGTVTQYDPVWGNGFILPDNGVEAEKVYVTETALAEKEYSMLRPGQRVSFEIEHYQTYRAAKFVHILS